MGSVIDFNKYKKIPEKRRAALDFVNRFKVAGLEYDGLKAAGKKFLTIREAIETALGKK
jgi:hypothetical protein